ncbi:hypothetical protein BDZ91DRAFT_818624 [Kalaharituber pfeilii]|nr:hypothetical protein BDZ91DRAFT_818624 [Kalaharituber pfeilii]
MSTMYGFSKAWHKSSGVVAAYAGSGIGIAIGYSLTTYITTQWDQTFPPPGPEQNVPRESGHENNKKRTPPQEEKNPNVPTEPPTSPYFLDCPRIDEVHTPYTPEGLKQALDEIFNTQIEDALHKQISQAPKAPNKEWAKKIGRPLKPKIIRKPRHGNPRNVSFAETTHKITYNRHVLEFLVEDPIEIETYEFKPPKILEPIFGNGVQGGILWTDIL